jgi:hypothetical protein
MAEDNLRNLEQRLLEDDQLRERFRQSPHDVLAEHGVTLTDEQSQRLTERNLSAMPPEALQAHLQAQGTRTMW